MKTTLKLLKKAKNIALFSHNSPDPDTIGSTLALKLVLEQLGKKVDVFCSDINNKYEFLEDYKFYKTSEDADLNVYDLLVAVDIPESDRLQSFESKFFEHPNTLSIDHHAMGNKFAGHNLVQTVSACGVLIFEIAKNLKVKLSPQIATYIYFAICGDTGVFKNNNTDSVTFKVCATLLECGADFKRVYSEFFSKITAEYLKLSSHILLNAEINDDYKYAILSLTNADFEKYNPEKNESVSNLPHSYLNAGCKIAVILKEKEDGIYCSLRSKYEYDCSKIAAAFGGGGHKNAAGCKFEVSMSDAKKQIAKQIENYLNNL